MKGAGPTLGQGREKRHGVPPMKVRNATGREGVEMDVLENEKEMEMGIERHERK